MSFEIDFGAIRTESVDADRRNRAEFASIVARLEQEPEFREKASAAYGVNIDPRTEEGMAGFMSLMATLGNRQEGFIREEVDKLRLRDEAKRRYNAEQADAREPLPLTGLGDLLSADIAAEEYAIEGLLHAGGNVLFTAARKSGKSTVIGNLIRSLVDGDDFLGAFPANLTRRVVLVDLELSPATLQKWLREQGIKNTENVTVVSLRGKSRAFNILDDATRAELAEQLRGHDTLILDPLRPLADALGLNEHTEMGRLLEAFDALKAEAGISEGIIVHHHGHGSDRARGDSRLEDWPDALWRLKRSNLDDPHAIRSFSAFGRDVAVDDGALRLDGRRLTYAGDIATVKAESAADAVVAFLRTSGECSTSQITDGVATVNKNNTASVLQAALTSGAITLRKEGTRNLYSAATPF